MLRYKGKVVNIEPLQKLSGLILPGKKIAFSTGYSPETSNLRFMFPADMIDKADLATLITSFDFRMEDKMVGRTMPLYFLKEKPSDKASFLPEFMDLKIEKVYLK